MLTMQDKEKEAKGGICKLRNAAGSKRQFPSKDNCWLKEALVEDSYKDQTSKQDQEKNPTVKEDSHSATWKESK